MTLAEKLYGGWVIVSRVGWDPDTLPKSIRMFNEDGTYIWDDYARKDPIETGSWTALSPEHLICRHGSMQEIYAIVVHGPHLTINRINPTVGEVTHYRRNE
jgi:hypothetical protein